MNNTNGEIFSIESWDKTITGQICMDKKDISLLQNFIWYLAQKGPWLLPCTTIYRSSGVISYKWLHDLICAQYRKTFKRIYNWTNYNFIDLRKSNIIVQEEKYKPYFCKDPDKKEKEEKEEEEEEEEGDEFLWWSDEEEE